MVHLCLTVRSTSCRSVCLARSGWLGIIMLICVELQPVLNLEVWVVLLHFICGLRVEVKDRSM